MIQQMKDRISAHTTIEMTAHHERLHAVKIKDTDPQSLTFDWELLYYMNQRPTDLEYYFPFHSFSTLTATKFSSIRKTVQVVYEKYVEQFKCPQSEESKIVVFEYPRSKFTCYEKNDDVMIVFTVIDERSPFQFISMPFLIKTNEVNGFIAGENMRWDRKNDTYVDKDAQMSPKHELTIYVDENEPSVRLEQYPQETIYCISHHRAKPMPAIDSPMKALAYANEQLIIEHTLHVINQKKTELVKS